MIPTAPAQSVLQWRGTWAVGVLHSDKFRDLSRVVDWIGERCDVPSYVPTRRERRDYTSSGNGRRSYDVPLFPGYFFVCFPEIEQFWFPVRYAPGVCNILAVADQRRFAAELANIQLAIERAGEVERYPGIVPGVPVRIVRGQFAGIRGEVEHRNDRGRVLLRLTEMNASAVLEVGAGDVELIG